MRLGMTAGNRSLRRLWAGVVGILAASGFAQANAAGVASLARYFPRQDLAVYAEFDGLAAHDDLWRKTAAYRLLNETPTGAMFQTLAIQLAERSSARSLVQGIEAADLLTLAGHLARQGFALGVVNDPGRPRPRWVGLVIRGGGNGKVREILEKLVAGGRSGEQKPRQSPKAKGRTVSVEGEGPGQAAWWQEGDDLAVSWLSPDGADAMIEALDGGRPNATDHPDRAALDQTVDGFTPIGLAFADVSAFAPLSPQAAALGLDRVKRVDYRWGIQGDALMTVTRLAVPAPRSGLLALFDQPPLGPEGLASLPAGLAGITAFSVDLGAVYDRFAAGVASTSPNARASLDSAEVAIRNATGLRVRDDLLARLGSKVVYYALPARGDASVNALAGFAQGLLRTPRAVAIFEVKDGATFARLIDGAVARLQGSWRDRPEAGSKPPPLRIHPLKGVEHGYVVSLAPSVAPLPAGFRPTFIVAGSALILAANPDEARAALELRTRGGALPATDPLALPISRMPRGTIMASVVDDRRSLLPELVANLPMLVQWGPRMSGGRLSALQIRRLMAGMGGARGVPMMNAPGVQLDIDPNDLPTPEEIRPFLAPSVFTLTADEQGVELRTREAFPVLNPAAMAPVAAAMVVPAIQSARAAAQRSESVNNLKRIGLALHNFHSAMGTFPPQATYDKATKKKPLLSWRVALLPYLEEAALYNEFKLDEPWDSPHNKALIPRMPKVFAVPGAKAEPGKTYYRGFAGRSTLFDPQNKAGAGVGIQDVTDGTSNTLAIVEAKDAVIWTKPEEEIPVDENMAAQVAVQLLAKMGTHYPGGFNALFTDGSVRFIKTTINAAIFRCLITRNGGEIISNNAF